MKYYTVIKPKELAVFEVDGSKESIKSLPEGAEEITEKEYLKIQENYSPIKLAEKRKR